MSPIYVLAASGTVLAVSGVVLAASGAVLAASGAVLAASKLRKIKIHLGDLVIQALLLQTFEGLPSGSCLGPLTIHQAGLS